ncbi:YbjN domain-containing protein, partial [Nocardia gipuzkoensis]
MPETAQLIEDTLRDREVEYTREGEDVFIVVLPGERKLKTTVMLTVGTHGLRFECFVCRKPDENFEGVYKFLLRRNRRLYGVAYTLDRVGDIYLIGRVATHAVTADELDRIFGQILEAVDADF